MKLTFLSLSSSCTPKWKSVVHLFFKKSCSQHARTAGGYFHFPLSAPQWMTTNMEDHQDQVNHRRDIKSLPLCPSHPLSWRGCWSPTRRRGSTWEERSLWTGTTFPVGCSNTFLLIIKKKKICLIILIYHSKFIMKAAKWFSTVP